MIVAHGSGLDEAVIVLVSLGVVAALAWVGGRKDKREERDEP